MVMLKSQNKINDFTTILAWLSPFKYLYSYSAGIDFRRHNLKSTDVGLWRLKSIPALWGLTP